MTIHVEQCDDGRILLDTVSGDVIVMERHELPYMIAKLQEYANLPSIPALQAQLARVQDIARERQVEIDRLTNENEALHGKVSAYKENDTYWRDKVKKLSRPIDDTDCYVAPTPVKYSQSWWDQQDSGWVDVVEEPMTSIAVSLNRIADRLEDHILVAVDKP